MDKRIEWYKEAYMNMYGHRPPEKCIESFCRINGIEQNGVEELPPDEAFWRTMDGGSELDG
jgi:hypothetical protein